MAASVLCRFQDDTGAVFTGTPTATDDQGLPTEVALFADQAAGIFGDLAVGAETKKVAKLLAPLEPKTIMCIGLNYAKHAAESGMAVPTNPVVFHKTVSTLNNPGDFIDLPKIEHKPDWEVELAIVIGKEGCKNVSEADALSYVLGYTVANDVSGREWQIDLGGGQWCFGKSFDTFTPLGPVIATTAAIPDPQKLQVKTTIDGQVLQDSNTDDMVFSCAKIIAFLSQDTTLLPGTVICTGTPFGVGLGLKPQRWLKPGEVVTVEIEGIGKLTNPVRAAL